MAELPESVQKAWAELKSQPAAEQLSVREQKKLDPDPEGKIRIPGGRGTIDLSVYEGVSPEKMREVEILGHMAAPQKKGGAAAPVPAATPAAAPVPARAQATAPTPTVPVEPEAAERRVRATRPPEKVDLEILDQHGIQSSQVEGINNLLEDLGLPCRIEPPEQQPTKASPREMLHRMKTRVQQQAMGPKSRK